MGDTSCRVTSWGGSGVVSSFDTTEGTERSTEAQRVREPLCASVELLCALWCHP